MNNGHGGRSPHLRTTGKGKGKPVATVITAVGRTPAQWLRYAWSTVGVQLR